MNELNPIKIGQRIRSSRERMLITQEKLAELLDVSVKFVSDIELGAKGMSLKTLNRLSQCLLISTDYILYGGDDDELSGILSVIRKCPPEKRKYAEDILKIYVKSVI